MSLFDLVRRPAMCAVAVLLSGCAYFNPAALKPGATLAEIQERLGPPTGSYPLPGGGQRVEYARGPMGKETWMLELDPRGSLLSAEQVLTEAHFNTIRAGTPRDALRFELGRPSHEWNLSFQKQTVWSYRYENVFCTWFQVGIDAGGKVVDTGYYPDPMCGDHDQRDPIP